MKNLFLLSLVLFIFSCKKDKIVINNQTHINGLEPSFALPLANSTLNLGNLEAAHDDDNFVYNEEDEILALTYQKELFTYRINDLLDIPTQNNSVSIEFDSDMATSINALDTGLSIEFPMATTFDFTFSNGEELDEINISDGLLNFSILSDLKEDITIQITFPTVRLNNNPLSITENLVYNGTVPVFVSSSFNLDNYQITFNNDGVSIPMNISATVTKTNEDVSVGESINFDTQFQINEISSAIGYFGQYTNLFSSEVQTFNLFPNVSDGVLYFADPKIKFILTNSAGIDLALDINDIQLLSNGVTTNLTGPDITNFPIISGATTIGDSTTTTHQFSNSGLDPSLSSMFTLESSEITYSTTASTNPNGYTSNFLIDSSKVTCLAEVVIPLYLRAENIKFSDTIDLDLSDVFKEDESSEFDVNDVEQVTLRLLISNGFPLDIDTKMYFADENLVILDSLWNESSNDNLFISGLVDFTFPNSNPNYGRVTSPTTSKTDYVLTQERLDNLTSSNSKKLIIKTTGHTPSANQGEFVKFYPEYELGVKLSAKVDFNIDIN